MAVSFVPRPLTLEGKHVRLEPLAPEHASDLYEAGRDESIWTYLPGPAFKSLGDTERWIAETLQESLTGRQIAFAIVANDKAMGSTRYLDIQVANRSLEIGWTWLGVAVQRTPVNTDCKYLLLTHAFEDLGAIRVQLKTDARNVGSQKAIERIGAKREGTLRKHYVLWDGHVRDSVYFSVLEEEWPDVKTRLEKLLSR